MRPWQKFLSVYHFRGPDQKNEQFVAEYLIEVRDRWNGLFEDGTLGLNAGEYLNIIRALRKATLERDLSIKEVLVKIRDISTKKYPQWTNWIKAQFAILVKLARQFANNTFEYKEKASVEVNRINESLLLLQLFVQTSPFPVDKTSDSQNMLMQRLSKFCYRRDFISKSMAPNESVLMKLQNEALKQRCKQLEEDRVEMVTDDFDEDVEEEDVDVDIQRETQPGHVLLIDEFMGNQQPASSSHPPPTLAMGIYDTYYNLESLVKSNTKRMLNVVVSMFPRQKGLLVFVKEMVSRVQPTLHKWGVYFYNLYFLSFARPNNKSIFYLLAHFRDNVGYYIDVKAKMKTLRNIVESTDKDEGQIKSLVHIVQQLLSKHAAPATEEASPDIHLSCEFYMGDKRINPRWVDALFELSFTTRAINAIESVLPDRIDLSERGTTDLQFELLERWEEEKVKSKQLKSKMAINNEQLSTLSRFTRGKKDQEEEEEFPGWVQTMTSGTKKKKNTKSSLDVIRQRTGWFIKNMN